MTKQTIREIRSRIYYYEAQAYKLLFPIGGNPNPLGARINLAKSDSLRDYLQDMTGEIHSSYTIEDYLAIQETLTRYHMEAYNE